MYTVETIAKHSSLLNFLLFCNFEVTFLFYKFTHVTIPPNVIHNDEKGNVLYSIFLLAIAKQLH
jgi:hypothetical protein